MAPTADAGAVAITATVAVSKDNTYGASFVGFAASCVLFGVICSQTWTYLKRYPLDRMFYKILVLSLWAIEAGDQALIGHATYFYTVTNWGNPLVLLEPAAWSLVIQIVLGAFAGTVVKICFAMRVWRFSNGNRPITAIIVILALTQMGVACVYTQKALALESLAIIGTIKSIGSLSLILGVATDMITAAALCWFLRGLRTGYSKDDSLVNSLTLYAINTGVLTSIVSLATMILYNTMPDNFIFMALYFVLSKLYVNSLLATLNTRRVLRGRGTDAETNTMPTFLMVGKLTRQENQFRDHVYPPSSTEATSRTKAAMLASQASALEVEVEQEVTITRDSYKTRSVDEDKKPGYL